MVLCQANFIEYELRKYHKTEHKELKNEKEGRKEKGRKKINLKEWKNEGDNEKWNEGNSKKGMRTNERNIKVGKKKGVGSEK